MSMPPQGLKARVVCAFLVALTAASTLAASLEADGLVLDRCVAQTALTLVVGLELSQAERDHRGVRGETAGQGAGRVHWLAVVSVVKRDRELSPFVQLQW